jgi:O-succinylbenzoic acid--CoA ligase
MGKDQRLLIKALEQPDQWLVADHKTQEKVLATLHKIASGEGIVLGGNHPAIRGKILIATGGTSGNPKFAIHSWESLAAAARALMGKIGENIQSCGILPMHHVSGLMPIVRAILSEGKYFQGDPGNLFEHPEGKCLSLVPTQLNRYLKVPQTVAKLRQFRMIFVGGANSGQSLLDQAAERELPLAPCYGMTETAAMVTLLPPEEFLSGQRGCGKPLPGVQIETGELNQIRISCNSLAEGYSGKDDPISKPFPTQDTGFFDEEGSLHITGRLDRTIISGGENVNPAEVEAELREFAFVEDALVVGIPDEEWGQKIIAFIKGKPTTPESLKAKLKQVIPAHKVPKEILFVRELPLNVQGKVDWEFIEKTRTTSPA